MNFKKVEVDVFDKTVLREAGLAVFFEVIYIDIQPGGNLKVEGMAYLVKRCKYLFGTAHVRRAVTYDHIADKMIMFKFFCP